MPGGWAWRWFVVQLSLPPRLHLQRWHLTIPPTTHLAQARPKDGPLLFISQGRCAPGPCGPGRGGALLRSLLRLPQQKWQHASWYRSLECQGMYTVYCTTHPSPPLLTHHILLPCLLCPISSFVHLYPSKQASVFDFSVKDAQGNDVSLRKFEDKKALLIVNVASR